MSISRAVAGAVAAAISALVLSAPNASSADSTAMLRVPASEQTLSVCVPGIDAKEFPAGEPIRCRYRVWIHRGVTDKSAMEKVYAAYLAGEKSAWK